MTKADFIKIAKGLKAAYPSTSFLPDSYSIDIWYSMLKHLSYEQMSYSAQKHIATSKFAPTIADILANAQAPADDLTEAEAWAMVRRAISNSGYHAVEEFEKLPPLVQKAAGSADYLYQLATAASFNESVESSNFKRAYRTAQARAQEIASLPPQLQEQARALFGANSFAQLENQK